MNVTFGMWTLLVGGLVLPDLESPMGPPGGMVYQPPNIADFRMQAPPSSLQRPQLPYRGTGSIYRSGSQYGRPGMAGGPAASATRPGFGPAAQVDGQAGSPQQFLPLAPTNPAAAAESYPFAPPTEGMAWPAGGASAGAAGQLPGPYALPDRAPPAFTPAPAASVQRPAPAQSSAPRTPAQGLAPKPFSDYRQPSGTSPYMNLFRSDDSFGAIDQYNQWVKPRVQQGQFNQQVGGQVSGLQGAGRLQGMDIRTLGRATQNLQRSGTRPRFMNYGGYYPGMQR